MHGANRLAGNSLLEGLVFGKRAASHALTCENPAQNWGGLVAAPVSPLVSLSDESAATFAEAGTQQARVCHSPLSLSLFFFESV